MISTWQATLPDGKSSEELLLSFDAGRSRRILILPAWFDEANKLRRFTCQLMRSLDNAGVDSFLPDLPGCNESLVPLSSQTLAHWRTAALDAARDCSATHVLAMRAGALIAPQTLPGWHYAPQSGPKLLRGMIRARVIAAKEAGKDLTSADLMDLGRRVGLTLAGWPVSAAMICELETAEPQTNALCQRIEAKDIGPGLWLRAEPGEDLGQAERLAEILAENDEASS